MIRHNDVVSYTIIEDRETHNVTIHFHVEKLVLDNVVQMKQKLRYEIDLQEFYTLTIDMKNVLFIDSTALGVGVNFYTKFVMKGKMELTLKNLSSQPLRVIQLTGLTNLQHVNLYDVKGKRVKGQEE